MKHTLNNSAMSAREQTELGLSVVIDVFDEGYLFESIDNERVLELSRLGGRSGFSGTKAIQKSTGIANRRILHQGLKPVDLGVQVFRKLQHQAACELSSFDHILLCHSHVRSEESVELARQLEVHFDLAPNRITPFNHGCAGFLKLMTEASILLEDAEPGSKVAMVSVETPEFWHDAADRLFCGIVSAGATAAVMEVGRGLLLSTIQSEDFRIPESRRPNPDPLFSKETTDVFDFRGLPCQRTVMRMNPEPVFLNGIELMLDNLRSALMSIDYQLGQRVVVAPHQPSGKLLKALTAAARTEFPEIEFLNNLEGYGNTISSSVPTLVSRLDQVMQDNKLLPLQEGDAVILLAAGICMNEIDNHMSAGHACLTWQPQLLNSKQSRPAEIAVNVH